MSGLYTSLAERIAKKAARRKHPTVRGRAARISRRMQRRHNRAWRINGARPRGRGYDWARTLIAEVLLAQGSSGLPFDARYVDLASRVGCTARYASRIVHYLCTHNGWGAPAVGRAACVMRIASRRGRGGGVILQVQLEELGRRVELRTKRGDFPRRRTRQMQLPHIEQPAELRPELAAIIARARLSREEWEAAQAADARSRRRGNQQLWTGSGDISDRSPHTPHSQKIPSSADGLSDLRSASRLGANIATIAPGPRSRAPDREQLRLDFQELKRLDVDPRNPLPEALRRRLYRHLRFVCWHRGLDSVSAGKLTSCIGWHVVRLRKASSRKYLLHDCIAHILLADREHLRKKAARWCGCVDLVLEAQGLQR